ncbi:MAG: cytidine deaminase, partial [Clostridia bacterium]|nr:cytidine deaminase [Clostridia bacterium]
PCGACRQALAEFGPNLTVITQIKEGGDFLVFSLAELLPVPFRL